MPVPSNAAAQRFTAVWAASLALKLAGLALFLVIVMKLTGAF